MILCMIIGNVHQFIGHCLIALYPFYLGFMPQGFKTMADKLIYIPIMIADTQKYPFVDYN